MAQGYFLSRPMPAGELPGWLKAWSLGFPDRRAA
jgi:EAL domain-containing protein (putative c-di-GMP-specific phosphodiesterase class I)